MDEIIPRKETSKKKESKAIMEGSILKTISLELKKNLMGKLGKNVTQYPHTQTQPSPSTQPSSEHTSLMDNQLEIQSDTCKSMIT